MPAQPEAMITPYPDGPYLVRGTYRIVDHRGREIEVTRRTVALCRCGRSRIKPWCDGNHKRFKFDDSPRSS
ncbi:MAG: CDGSH iron-sulfur domain-containing protein, partial [Actinomycetota bacterium]